MKFINQKYFSASYLKKVLEVSDKGLKLIAKLRKILELYANHTRYYVKTGKRMFNRGKNEELP